MMYKVRKCLQLVLKVKNIMDLLMTMLNVTKIHIKRLVPIASSCYKLLNEAVMLKMNKLRNLHNYNDNKKNEQINNLVKIWI